MILASSGEGTWELHGLLGASGSDPGGSPRGRYRADPAYTNGGSARETQNVHVTGAAWAHRLKHHVHHQKVASRVGETPKTKVGCNSV